MPFYTIQKREIGHECFLLNGYNLAAILAQVQGDIPALARSISPYSIVLNLWGGQFFPAERIAYEEKAVGEIAAQYNFTPGEKLDGIPEANLRLQKMLNRPWEGEVYWKERMAGGCLEFVMEAGLDKVPAYWKLFKQIAGECGMDTTHLGIYIQPRQRARVCHVEFHIPCDPQDAGELAQAKTFHRAASLQPKRYAFQHGTRHVGAAVPQGQADERAARQRVGMRRPFAGKIWQELESLTPSRDRFRLFQ